MPRRAIRANISDPRIPPASLPIRKTFAALLLCVALLPIAMVICHTVSPLRLVAAWAAGRDIVAGGALYGGVACLLALLYPPAVPFLRLRVRELWRRLGTDRSPIYDGIARLQHLETHDDHLKVGRMAWQLGDAALALEHLGRAHELDPTHAAGRFHYALVLADRGQPEFAEQLLAALVSEDEKHAFGDALFHLGRVRARLGRHGKAIETLQRHQALFPGHRQAALLLARSLATTGDLDAANAALGVARRDVEPGEHLPPAEALARARARVAILRRGRADA